MGAATDDWRRMGQELDLAGLTWTWKRYQAYSSTWEHDHCAFCFRKFLDRDFATWMREALEASTGDPAGAGYTNVREGETDSGRHWVCEHCFEDFAPEFGWAVVESDPEAWPFDTPEPDPRPRAEPC